MWGHSCQQSLSYTGQVGLQIWGGQKLQRWHDGGPGGYTVTLPPSSFSIAWRINRVWRAVCVFVCKHSFKEFSLRTPSYVTLPQWTPVHDPYKKRGMPTSCYPQACQSCLKGEGPHNLLFVPLLLRKYFLNSSFSFVYFYCSYFLPWFNPVLSYLFAF